MKNEKKRLKRGEYYMEIAKTVALRGTCPRASVGAVLVNPETKQIVATGYNGSASGSPHCSDVGCLLEHKHCRRTVHAEMNAVLHLEHQYPSLDLYCTHQPCYQCYKALVAANVKRIYYLHPYRDPLREKLRKESNKGIMFWNVSEGFPSFTDDLFQPIYRSFFGERCERLQ